MIELVTIQYVQTSRCILVKVWHCLHIVLRLSSVIFSHFHFLSRGNQNTSTCQISNALEHLQFHRLCHTPLPLHLWCPLLSVYDQDLYQQADSGHARAHSNCSFHFPLLCSTAALSVKTIICSRWRGDTIITAIPKIWHYHYMPNNCPWFFQCVSLHASDMSPPS